jgi:hypothetical protein
MNINFDPAWVSGKNIRCTVSSFSNYWLRLTFCVCVPEYKNVYFDPLPLKRQESSENGSCDFWKTFERHFILETLIFVHSGYRVSYFSHERAYSTGCASCKLCLLGMSSSRLYMNTHGVLPTTQNSEQLRVFLLVKIKILRNIAMMSLSLNVGIPISRSVWICWCIACMYVFMCACQCVREWCVCVCVCLSVCVCVCVCVCVSSMHKVTRILHILNTATLEDFYFSCGTVHKRFLVGSRRCIFIFWLIFLKQRSLATKTPIHELRFCGHFWGSITLYG